MSRSYYDIAFTRGVRDAQVHYGSRAAQDRLHRPAAGDRSHRDPLGADEEGFITGRDGFYLATVSETGWPYVQFRGGPAGFVTVPDEHTLAWPDFRGNRQYVTTGNLGHDARVAIIFMDYAHQVRLKLYGTARVHDVARGTSVAAFEALSRYPAKVERVVHVDVTAYDWNCPQHITPRYTVEELAPSLEPLQRRLEELEAENARLREGQFRADGQAPRPGLVNHAGS